MQLHLSFTFTFLISVKTSSYSSVDFTKASWLNNIIHTLIQEASGSFLIG